MRIIRTLAEVARGLKCPFLRVLPFLQILASLGRLGLAIVSKELASEERSETIPQVTPSQHHHGQECREYTFKDQMPAHP